jgi:hypothetical protein
MLRANASINHRLDDRFDESYHGSSLDPIEGFLSKLARSILRHIRVSSKQALKDRLIDAID